MGTASSPPAHTAPIYGLSLPGWRYGISTRFIPLVCTVTRPLRYHEVRVRSFRFIYFLLFACCLSAMASRHDWKDLRKQVRETLHIPEKLPKLEKKRYDDFSLAPGIAAER